MTTPRWWSQPFPPTGAIASEGIRNQLGRPPVDPMTVFVRETAQNSWDARLPGSPTTYRLEISTVAASHRPNWERLLAPPSSVEPHLGVGKVVRAPNLRLLSVIDRGTKGLGGPTRADELAQDRRDWVSFVLNVGEKRDTQYGGGTYGYGKAVLYLMSRVGTILVYTRTEQAGHLESRLIGISLRQSFESRARVDEESRPFTGRHWWGDVQDDHVEPLIGSNADSVARSLGLAPFGADESGTTLTVLDPDLGEFGDAVDEAAQHLADTIAWQLWPIMLPEKGVERLTPAVVAGGRAFDVPDPTETYPLDLFVDAYRTQHVGDGKLLECRNPRQPLGRFAVEEAWVLPMSKDAVTRAAAYAGVSGDPHHICLMRSPELVVRYLEQTETGSINRAYAGVFRALDELDDVYAASEPPTHDNWVHEQLNGRQQTFIRTTFRRIKEELSHYKSAEVVARPAGQGTALGAAANLLGGIVAAAFARPDPSSTGSATGGGSHAGPGGPGGGAGGRGGRRPSPVRRVQASPLTEPTIDERAGQIVLVQRFAVQGPGPAFLHARLSIGLGQGSKESEAPAGAGRPEVLAWVTADGECRADTCIVESPSEVDLVVLPVADTITDITVVAAPASAVTP